MRKSAGNPIRWNGLSCINHNYEIRYWLAAAGIRPGYYVDLASGAKMRLEPPMLMFCYLYPPPSNASNLEAKQLRVIALRTMNQQAHVGSVPVTTNYDIWKTTLKKFLALPRSGLMRTQTLIAITKALIRAGMWLDKKDDTGNYINRHEAARILSQPEYVGRL